VKKENFTNEREERFFCKSKTTIHAEAFLVLHTLICLLQFLYWSLSLLMSLRIFRIPLDSWHFTLFKMRVMVNLVSPVKTTMKVFLEGVAQWRTTKELQDWWWLLLELMLQFSRLTLIIFPFLIRCLWCFFSTSFFRSLTEVTFFSQFNRIRFLYFHIAFYHSESNHFLRWSLILSYLLLLIRLHILISRLILHESL
jgi:hypothetical protein